MKLTWYGTASILLETENSIILFDPYLKYLPKDYEQKNLLKNRRSAFEKAQSIFITHGHFDHLASIKELYSNLPCKVYLSNAPYKTLRRRRFNKEKMQIISVGQTIAVGDFNVKVIQGKHVKFVSKDIWESTKKNFGKLLDRRIKLAIDYLRYPEKGETLFYEIEVEGKLIQLMGSADLCDKVSYNTGADLLIIPHQGRNDIDEHNKIIVKTLKPKRVLLDHYDDAFPPFSATIPTDDFCNAVSKEIPTEALKEGVTIEI